MKKYFLVMSALLLASCSTVETINFSDAPVPEESSELSYIYVYREVATPFFMKAYLEIDSQQVMALNNGNYTWASVDPGVKTITYTWGIFSGMPTVNFDMEFKAGQTYAFEMIGQSAQYFSAVELVPMSLDSALEEMEKCCGYVPPVTK